MFVIRKKYWKTQDQIRLRKTFLNVALVLVVLFLLTPIFLT